DLPEAGDLPRAGEPGVSVLSAGAQDVGGAAGHDHHASGAVTRLSRSRVSRFQGSAWEREKWSRFEPPSGGLPRSGVGPSLRSGSAAGLVIPFLTTSWVEPRS